MKSTVDQKDNGCPAVFRSCLFVIPGQGRLLMISSWFQLTSREELEMDLRVVCAKQEAEERLYLGW